MATYKDLRLGLEILTEGREASVPRALSTESFMVETVAIQKKSRNWTHGSGIQGLGISEKQSDGKQLKQLALKVYVKEKLPLSKVSNPVPKKVQVAEVGSLVTDVEAIGLVEPEVFTDRVRPAMPGCGLGHVDVTVGTFGCLVKKKGKTGLYILSNSHVLANEGIASVGDRIIQPGSHDGGQAPRDTIAKLAEFVPFIFSRLGFPNQVDAAIAKVASSAKVTPKIRLLGIKPQGVSTYVRRGMTVVKVGRTTDFTVGEIRDVDYRLALNYMSPGGTRKRAGLRDQVLCTRYTAGGDSGSAVLNKKGKIVGLHFAGSPSTSIFNRIGHVMRLLEIRLA